MPFPYIYTFYSFKGGVGRSLALLNVAYALAGRGRHVLIVDMDLEAPGVSAFLRRHDEVEIPTPGERPRDVLSLVEAALAQLPESGDGLEEAARQLPPLQELLWPVRAECLAPLKPKLGSLGRLDVLGAEFSQEYLQRLAELRLKGLSRDQMMRLSNLLRVYFKNHRFAHRPLGVESFEEPLQTPYDYILIDSRTGVTEIGGLCVGPLADRLVVLTGLNDQNVEGTATLLGEIGIALRARHADDQKWDDADPVGGDAEESQTLGPKPTILVATPVPSGETELKRERLNYLKERLGIRPASLSYFPRLALMEALVVRDFAEELLSREYEGLADRVMEQIGDDSQVLWRKFDDQMKGEIDFELVSRTALRLAPVDPQLGEFVLSQVHNAAVDVREFLAIRRVSAYLASLPSHSEIALGTWGIGLSDQARFKQGEEADRFFELAYQKYEESLRIKPDKHEILSNWGTALSDQAKQKHGDEADRLFELAYQKYEAALRIRPNFQQLLSNWGNALSEQARQKQGEEADRLFQLAGQNCEAALRVDPEFDVAWLSWGVVLSRQAEQKHGGEANRLFELACQKYEGALRIKPDKHEALSNWGVALMSQSSRVDDPLIAASLRREARTHLMKAQQIQPGSSAYNLARLSALESHPPEAIQWLEVVRSDESKRVLVTQAKLAADPAFEPIRQDPEFVRYLQTLPPA